MVKYGKTKGKKWKRGICMEILLRLQDTVGTGDFLEWIIISLISCFIFSIINVFLFINLFKVKLTNKKTIGVILLQTILRFVSTLFLPIFLYRAVGIVRKYYFIKIIF